MVRALDSHQCGPGSNPGVDAICGLSLLLVLSLAPRGFSPGTPVFLSPQKPTISNSNSTRNQVDEEPLCGCATCKSLFIYLFKSYLLMVSSLILLRSLRVYILKQLFFEIEVNSGRWLNWGKSLVIHCAFLTVHNKIAAVKKSIRSNIIKMKLTEEKRFWNFRLRLFLAEMRLVCWECGFDFLRRTLIVYVRLVLTHFDLISF